MKLLFVFVHGAMHSASCFDKKLIPIFRKNNYKTITFDLPGCGDDNTDIDKINLELYVNYTINIINENINENEKVVLVGHSLGGLTISKVADIIPDKIERLIYIAAIIPENNKKLFDNIKIDQSVFEIDIDNKYLKIKEEKIKNMFYNNCNSDDVEFAKKILRPQPIKPANEIVLLSENFNKIPKIYISTLSDNMVTLDQQKNYIKINKFMKTINIDSDHSPFFSNPEKLYDIIINHDKY